MKRAPFGAVVVLGAVLLAGCAGRIDSVTNVTQVAATVNTTVSCNQGEAGQVWVEHRRTAVGGAWTQAGRQSFNCTAPISVPWPVQLTGLTPGTAYQVRLCYDPAPIEGTAACVDKNGTVNGTNYASFTTSSAASACSRNATPSTFASEVSAASAGQTVCLASGNYGTFQGTNKAITIRAAAGATPTMRYQFGSGDSGFTLTGLSGMGAASPLAQATSRSGPRPSTATPSSPASPTRTSCSRATRTTTSTRPRARRTRASAWAVTRAPIRVSRSGTRSFGAATRMGSSPALAST